MSIRLFDIQNNKITPTEHCYAIVSLKDIMDNYPKDYNSIYAYLFYKSCLNEEENPFANVAEKDKEDIILQEVGGDFSTDEPLIVKALSVSQELYKTPTYKAYLGIKVMLENLADYLLCTPITDGRDGNLKDLKGLAKDYDDICRNFESRYKAFKEESSRMSRGGHDIAYDQ